jgi:polyisoprenoid-binding protein YceI
MKNFVLTTFLFALFSSLVIAQEKGTLSDAKISFLFVSKNVKGTIAGFASSSTFDTNDLSTSKFKGSVKIETIETGNFLRNWSLRGSKYFDMDNYPLLKFESTSITKTEQGFKVEGQLTIKATTKTVSMNFVKEGNRLKGTTSLFSSDYGINIIKKSRDANKVNVALSFNLN